MSGEMPAMRMDQIIASFEDEYKPLLAQIPAEVLPTSAVHGKHSYTASLA